MRYIPQRLRHLNTRSPDTVLQGRWFALAEEVRDWGWNLRAQSLASLRPLLCACDWRWDLSAPCPACLLPCAFTASMDFLSGPLNQTKCSLLWVSLLAVLYHSDRKSHSYRQETARAEIQVLETLPGTGAGELEKRTAEKSVVPLDSVWWKSARRCQEDSTLHESSSSQREGACREPLAADRLPLVGKGEQRRLSLCPNPPWPVDTMASSTLQFRKRRMRWNGSVRRDGAAQGQLQAETVLRKGLLLMSASCKFSSVLTESY